MEKQASSTSSSSSSCYPRSSTIPFPFPNGPYPQQAALMDAMLQSLELVDQEQQKQQQNSSGSQRNKANVMLLESPTGTGKSLSLACASLAWLRYREEQDFLNIQNNILHVQSTSDNNIPVEEDKRLNGNDSSQEVAVPSSSSAVPSSAVPSAVPSSSAAAAAQVVVKKVSWLQNWIPQSTIQKQQHTIQIQKQCYQLATTSRQYLNQELNQIRKRITQRYNTYHAQHKYNNNMNNNRKDVLLKQVRNELVKEDIDHVKLQKRSVPVYLYNYKKKKQKQKKINDNHDFCLEEYKSDNENNDSKNYNYKENRKLFSNYNDDHTHDDNYHDHHTHDDNNHNHYNNKCNDNIIIHQGKRKRNCQQLLNGGNLDGSGITTTQSRIYKTTNNSNNNDDDYDDNHDNITTTIGNCEAGSGVRKIIYSARTHSQLSQFVSEVYRTSWGKDVRIVALGGRKMLCGNENVNGGGKNKKSHKSRSEAWITEKCLDLQKGLLVDHDENQNDDDENQNDNITHGNNDKIINTGTTTTDGGNDVMMKKKNLKRRSGGDTNKSNNNGGCPLMSSKEAIATLALHMLAKPSDIEDLVGLGGYSQTCAYYASRESLKAAEVVVVPYNTLLSKHARKAVGLSLKSSLVIIDEAHNIPETLRSLSSCQLTLPIIEGATSQLRSYVQRYASRLTGRNITYLTQIQKILVAFSKHLKVRNKAINNNNGNKSKMRGENENLPPSSTMSTSTELLFQLKLDNINLFNILKYLERSRLSQKLHGFTNTIHGEKDENGETAAATKKYDDDDSIFISKHISCMSLVEAFLQCLCGSQREGRVVVEIPKLVDQSSSSEVRRATQTYPSYRYLLLDPSIHFKNVIDEAHAVVLCGGTLRPFQHIATELFGNDEDMIQHAIKSENEFNKSNEKSLQQSQTFISRSLTTFSCGHVVSESNVLVTCLSNGPNNIEMDFRHSSRSTDRICNELGEACLLLSRVVRAGFVIFFPSYTYEAYVVQKWKKNGLYEKLNNSKTVFREPKSAGDVEKTLDMYSKSAVGSNGAILLCVINGKMSEGINFANDLARCVLVVGLPYPDITNPELKEKMNLLDKESCHKKMSISGQSYYENLCMRSVCQAIGRSIRHANDYATIVLADVRYATEIKIWHKLPFWLRSGNESKSRKISFNQNIKQLDDFFQSIDNKVKSAKECRKEEF